ncbi:alpha/beta fold hydrolase [Pseudomonas reactans]|uniref:alpha/beta fold hydrolase n=1 Tax=Pseudomonas reactans TaxID=117680 RepID=UPI0015B7FF31|nr:alpha/beta fold hydrolase [Pseudomonas reactans]
MSLNKLLAAMCACAVISSGFGMMTANAAPEKSMSAKIAAFNQVHYRYAQVKDVNVFYREAGDPSNPTVLLLHGFPTSSFMYRNLIPILSKRYHVLAPDLPGFGLTESPPQGQYTYSFENLSNTIDQFTQVLGLKTYALQVFDYGAPVGWRLAVKHPERVTAIVSQNGNAYVEGLSDGWAPVKKYWEDPSQANRDALRAVLDVAAIKDQYQHGTPDPSVIAPETYLMDAAHVGQPANAQIQLDLFRDYKANVDMYPQLQQYFRDYQPPLLAVWGKNDAIFIPPGAEAFKRDLKHADVRFFDTGHFALETHLDQIGADILEFLDRTVKRN